MRYIQCTGNYHKVKELLCCPNDLVLQNNAPSLAKIMLAHEQGKPLDASLMRDLPYNEIEHNPFHEKGLDLADLPRIAKELEIGQEELNNQIEREKLERQIAKVPSSAEPPSEVPKE